MQGQTSFQIIGSYSEEEATFEANISEDDVNTVSEQAGVSETEARKALDETNGDIAEAILKLSE